MLELDDVSYAIHRKGQETDLLHRISLVIPKGHFMAVVGPSGCGKTTLIKTIAGILEESEGGLFWKGKNLAEDAELEPYEIGYVPQFSVAYEHLTVEENVSAATRLRVNTLNARHAEQITQIVLKQTGLEAIADRRVQVLSGGQKRRLGLALELVSNPILLLCDEVTSGLDPRSEQEIIGLLHRLSQIDERILVNVTHSLAHLHLYDSILVLHEGRVVYHGSPDAINHYFSVTDTEDIYPRLSARDADAWRQSWQKYRAHYYKKAGIPLTTRSVPAGPPKLILEPPKETNDPDEDESLPESLQESLGDGEERLPGPWTQFAVLLGRRVRIFLRDRTQLALHFAILLGFPILVVLFTPGLFDGQSGMGIPPMPNLPTTTDIISSSNVNAELERARDIGAEQLKLGGLISGIVMFQVVLLALMGSNNSAREVVSERLIFEKEKLAGLSSFSYLLSKVVFLGVLCVIQAGWMTLFVQHFTLTAMGETMWQRFALLLLVTGALTSSCLAISAWMRSTEQASLLSIYFVGFQLPLSGAVLALPDAVAPVVRPLIAAYWSWAGQLDQINKFEGYGVGIERATPTSLAGFELCLMLLLAHVILGGLVAHIGCHRHRWD